MLTGMNEVDTINNINDNIIAIITDTNITTNDDDKSKTIDNNNHQKEYI